GRILIRVGELMPDKSLIQNLVELSVFIGEKLKTEKKTTPEIRILRIEIIIPGILEKTTVKEINTQKNGLKCRYYMKEGIILPDEVNPQTGIPTTDKIKYLEKLCQKTGIPPDAWEKDKFELWKF